MSVRVSARASARMSGRASVRMSVRVSVRASAKARVRASMGSSATESVVQGDHEHVPRAGEEAPVVQVAGDGRGGLVSAAVLEHASVQKNHHLDV